MNLLDHCGLALPAGFRGDGLPWGVTFLAPAWSKPDLLELGERWHAGGRGPQKATAQPKSCATRPARVKLAVVGAHLAGQPLNHQLTGLEARLVESAMTAAIYRLYALAGTTPPKPGLVRVSDGGAAIAVEVWELTAEAFGRFVAAVPPPMCIGTVRLENRDEVKGFLCEPAALAGATDITSFGGWRELMRSDSRARKLLHLLHSA